MLTDPHVAAWEGGPWITAKFTTAEVQAAQGQEGDWMVDSIAVTMSGTTVGSVTLDPAHDHLQAHRTAGGFRLHLPITVRLRMKTRSDSQPFLSNIRARLSVQDGVIHHIGEARCDEAFRGAEQESSQTSALVWSDTFAALAHYERLRAGKPPRLTTEVHGQACYLVNVGGFSQRLRTEPVAVSGRAEIAYPAHVWVATLRELKVAENVLVEVPVPGAPPTGWEGIWQALVEARGAFEQGGETGWSQCVVKVRHVLELWDKMEPEKKPLPDPPRGEWTKKDRLDGLRGHLRACAHLAAHPGALWSRDDALLMLATLSTLLAVRNP